MAKNLRESYTSAKENLGKKPSERVLPLRKALSGSGVFLPPSPHSRMKGKKKKKKKKKETLHPGTWLVGEQPADAWVQN